jgi:hypothetical protein
MKKITILAVLIAVTAFYAFTNNGIIFPLPASTGTGTNVIIMAGQSNATDRYNTTSLEPSLKGSLTGIKSYYKTADNSSANGSWVDMQAGVNTMSGSTGGSLFGISITMGFKLKGYGITPWILNTGYPSAYIFRDQLYQGSTNTWYPTSANKYTRCLTWNLTPALAAMPAGTKKIFIVWVHGESDSDSLRHVNKYVQNFKDFRNQFITDTGYSPIIILTKLSSGVSRISCPYYVRMRAAQDSIALTVPNVYEVYTDSEVLQTDSQHYTPESAMRIGYKVADLIAQLQK